MEIKVFVPPEMAPYAQDLEYFVSTMVRKLHTNRHKGTTADPNPLKTLELVLGELEEAERAIRQEGQFEAVVECVDIANYAFLAAVSLLGMTREQFDKLEDKSSKGVDNKRCGYTGTGQLAGERGPCQQGSETQRPNDTPRFNFDKPTGGAGHECS